MEIAITKNTAELERLEGIIQKNLGSFLDMGRALMEIRDRKYYQDVLGFETFDAYCKAKWDFSRSYAYRLMDSASVIDVVSPIGDIQPATESQCRALAHLEPQQQREAWQQAVETAPDGKVTAAHVQKVVKEMTAAPVPAVSKPAPVLVPAPSTARQRLEKSDAMSFVGIAISQMERIHPNDPKREDALQCLEYWIRKTRACLQPKKTIGGKQGASHAA